MAQRHMDRLTSFDTSFLTNEKSNGHMAIGAIMVCEGSAPSYDDFVTHIRSRLHLLPRLRQRLAVPPLHLGTPMWVDDPDFDVHKHVQHVTLPSPGTDAQFHELIGEYLSPPLDRSKPLWELWLTDGFEDDRFGIIYKTHHSMADGISATDVGMLLFDVEPKDEIVRTEEPWHPQTPPSGASLLGLSAKGFFGMFGGAAALALERRQGARARPGGGLGRRRRALGGGLEPDQAGAQGRLQLRHRPAAQLRLDDRPAGRLQTDQERARRHRQRRHPGGRRRRPAALARGPRRRRRRARAAGAGAGLGAHRERARRARQPADGDARPAARPHRRPRTSACAT